MFTVMSNEQALLISLNFNFPLAEDLEASSMVFGKWQSLFSPENWFDMTA